EILSGLVGSEMCIRDRWLGTTGLAFAILTGCGEGPGTLTILGTGEDSFEVLDARGTKIATGKTNSRVTLPAGSYMVVVNGAGKSIRVGAGSTATATLGTVVVEGAGDGEYQIYDPTGKKMLSTRPINKPMELQPGRYVAMLHGVGTQVVVRPKERTVIRTGTLAVRGSKHTFYSVYDATGVQKLDFRSGSRTIDLLPGSYQVRAGGKSFQAEIKPGETNTWQL
ncbi:MAG: hypothetical protein N2255_06100, partial [Kiritimatiellae bacterium]|nr:hypothetical protein [Kiritimatiellia bacterium]